MSLRSDSIYLASSVAKRRTAPARIIVISFLVAAVVSQPVSADTLTPIRRDLVHHFQAGLIAGIAGVSISSLIIRSATGEVDPASPPYMAMSISAISIAAAAGVTKEIVDFFGTGVPDILDLLFTVAGGAAGGGIGIYAALMWYNQPDDHRASLFNIAITAGASATVLFFGFVTSLTDANPAIFAMPNAAADALRPAVALTRTGRSF